MSARCIFVATVILLSPGAALSQMGSEAAILGSVRDTSDAVIPSAEIVVTNLDTGLTRRAVSDTGGSFEILALPPGPYSVTVSFRGFKTWNLARTVLTVGERSRIAPLLEIGAVSEQVSVESTTELIQTDKSSVEGVVQQKQIRELPLNGRNPVQLVSLMPGMRFLGQGNVERISTVQGFGVRDDQTEFQLDGLSSNSGMDEGGMGIPNVDTIAEFNVETSSFSAEHGRNPLQVIMVTKSGTNTLHGTLWEFLRNDALDARNTFATSKPALRRNQFGGAAGGPIIRNKTFFFGSFEGTTIRRQQIYNSTTVTPAMLNGDFSSRSKQIKDPLTGQPFPGNRIPEDRISSASRFFFPYILMPNSPDGQFRAIAPNPDDTFEYTGRIDHQISSNQRIYGRWITSDNRADPPHYKPDLIQNRTTMQHNAGINYTNALTPTMLLTAGFGYLRSDNKFTSAGLGVENLTQRAGIRGIGTEGREDAIGLPNVNFTGYTGFSMPWGVPGRLWMWATDLKAGMNLIHSAHSISYGIQYNDRTTFSQHSSHSGRGTFDFNGQYTGDAFADYLLGYLSGSRRNFPYKQFGMAHAPYTGIYLQDFWRIHPNVTLNLGLRYDRWHEKELYRGQGSTFDPAIGKAIAGETSDGRLDFEAQPVAPFLAEATKGLWVPASQVGVPHGLFRANGHFSPRLGLTWRLPGHSDVVLRVGYGLFHSSFRGNHTASSGGLPYRTVEQQVYSPSTLQRWETTWPDNPRDFVQNSITEAPAWNTESTKSHEWNVSVQKGLPFQSALTLSYLGSRVFDQVAMNPHNEVPPGRYTNLQAARPWPAFGTLNTMENVGQSWYNGLQVKWERRFANGFSSTLSYSFSKHISDKTPASDWGIVTPFAPAGYERGRSEFDRTHIMTFNSIYELPFGRGRRYMNEVHRIVNTILGGWQITGIYAFSSGTPLTFSVPGATLGNGFSTRANLVGDPRLSNPSAALWFDPKALAAPPLYQFGNSGLGIMDGPGAHSIDLGLMKNFHFTEARYFQFRGELFNAPNHVNLGNPQTSIGLAQTGKIFSAGSARQAQLGLKFYF